MSKIDRLIEKFKKRQFYSYTSPYMIDYLRSEGLLAITANTGYPLDNWLSMENTGFTTREELIEALKHEGWILVSARDMHDRELWSKIV